MRRIVLFILLLWCSITYAAPTLSESARVSLLTCTPGTEVWSKYGHTAIHIEDEIEGINVVFNYGIFNLMSDDFYWKFVRGETYYQLGIDSYSSFERFYGSIGRKTYYQELNLTVSQKQKIWDALLVNYRPENRYYLYNFVFDNCATRPYYLLKEALGDSIVSKYKGYAGVSFRDAISHYTGRGSWVNFGINMIFGSKADKKMTNEERLFLPEELMHYVSEAKLEDGSPLVKEQKIRAFEIAIVPWYAKCWWGIVLFGIAMVGLSLWDRRRGRCSWGVDVALVILYVVLLCLVVFLTFFSCHPLVGFNWRLLLMPLIHVGSRAVYFVKK